MTGLLIATILLVLGVIITVIWKTSLRSLISGRCWVISTRLIGTIFVLLVVTYLLLNLQKIQADNWVLISLYVGLVGVTALYAISTHRQAKVSAKMADEMREQRIIASRPVIIQRAVYKDSNWPDIKIGWTGTVTGIASYFSHFEVYNAGNGPAIEVEISILDEKKRQIDSLESTRRTFLKANDPPLKFCPSLLSEGVASYYVASEYQSIISRSSQQQTWYQTLLPFKPAKSSKEGEIYLATGELEFRDEVPKKDRIDAFSSRSKPK